MHLLAPFILAVSSLYTNYSGGDNDVEFIARVNREISGYLNCLEKRKYKVIIT